MTDGSGHDAVINLITHNGKTGEVTLVLMENEPWGRNGAHVSRLSDRLHGYVLYALGPQFAVDYPSLAGKKIRLRLDTHHPLGPAEVDFLYKFRTEILDERGIPFDIHEVGVRSFLKRTVTKKF